MPPAGEEFTAVDAIASPWIVGDCPDIFYKISDCHEVRGEKAYNLKDRNIYNKDGSLWYSYKGFLGAIDYYQKNTSKDFLPFAGVGDYGRTVILNMVGESSHWYEVEVNVKTHRRNIS